MEGFEFPRHHWRGSIEADLPASLKKTGYAFPRHHWRGSIEARRRRCAGRTI